MNYYLLNKINDWDCENQTCQIDYVMLLFYDYILSIYYNLLIHINAYIAFI